MLIKVPPVVPVEMLHNDRKPEQQEKESEPEAFTGFDKVFDKELEPYGDPDSIKQNYLHYKENR